METTFSIISLIIAVMSFVFAIVNFIFCIIRQRKQDTIDAFSALQSESLGQLNAYSPKRIKEISEDPHSAEYKTLSVLLARCEHFSVGVSEGIYDKKVLTKLAGRYFVGLYYKLEPMILKKRSLGQKENYYSEFEKVSKYILKRLSKNKRRED